MRKRRMITAMFLAFSCAILCACGFLPNEHHNYNVGSTNNIQNIQSKNSLMNIDGPWRVSVTAINNDPDDEKTNCTVLNRNDCVMFHFFLYGGEPGETLDLTAKCIYTNGMTSACVFESLIRGDTGCVGSYDGFPDFPSGTMKILFYDNKCALIGEASVELE